MARPTKPPRVEVNQQGYYEIRYHDGTRGQRVSTGTKDLSEATNFLAGWLHEQGQDQRRIPSVSELLETYRMEKLKGKTSRQTSIIKNSLGKLLGEYPVDALTADRIGWYCDMRMNPKLAKKPAETGTVRRELGVLIAAINHAKKQLRLNPAIIPHIELPEGSDPRTEIFTSLQLEQLIQLTAPAEGERCSRICRFVWLAMETASRRRAIETLRWSKQVDWKQNIISYDSDGERRRKVKRRARVPISDRLKPMLQRFYNERESDFVLDHDGQAYVAWGWLMKKAAEVYKDESFLTKVPHDLRRTWATQAAQAGVSLWDIAGVLADTVATVSKHYAHHIPDRLRGAVNFDRMAS